MHLGLNYERSVVVGFLTDLMSKRVSWGLGCEQGVAAH